MYCNLCLEDGEDHKHFKHMRITNAMKTFSLRWANLKEESVTLFGNAYEFIKEYNPLIKYLEKLTVEVNIGSLLQYPIAHMISKDYQKLNELKIKVTNITADIEVLINNGLACFFRLSR